LNRYTGESVSRAKEKIYQRTNVSNTGFRQKKMKIEVDVLDYVIGGVLSMEYEDG